MNGQVAIGLEILHGLLACAQSCNLIFDGCYFFDLFFEHLNFLLQEIILGLLISDHHLKPPIDSPSNDQTKEERREHGGLEGLFATLPRLLSVGE